jgi:hypothetical protein
VIKISAISRFDCAVPERGAGDRSPSRFNLASARCRHSTRAQLEPGRPFANRSAARCRIASRITCRFCQPASSLRLHAIGLFAAALLRCADVQAAPLTAAEGLPPVQRARLDYLFAAMARVDTEWAFASDAPPCLLLVGPERQWVVNCAEAPAGGFSLTPERYRAQPVFTRSAGDFGRAGQALSAPALLSSLPAAAYVAEPGALKPELPPRYPWLLVGTLEGLRANHPDFRECTTEAWLSVALHEYLHTRQLREPSFAPQLSRINTHALDPEVLRALYRRDAGYRARVEREYSLLTAAARQRRLGPVQARAVLRRWLGAYLARRADLLARADGAQLVQADTTFTYVEGLARYVESKFLVDPSEHAGLPIADDALFHGFAATEGRGYRAMPNRALQDQYFYAIGFHLGLLLDRIDPRWRRRVQAVPDWLLGVAQLMAAER